MSTTRSDSNPDPEQEPRKRPRLIRRWLVRLVLLPVLVLAFLLVLVYVPPVQHLVRGRAVSYLSARTGARVELKRLWIGFPLRVRLEGLHVADLQGDTLLYAGTLRTQARLRDLLQGRLFLSGTALQDVRAVLRQHPDTTFNFDFLVQAFAGGPGAAPADTTDGMEISADRLELERVRFTLDLHPSAVRMEVALGAFTAVLNDMALDPLRFHLDTMDLQGARVDLRVPPSEPTPPSYPALTNPLADLDLQFKVIGLEDVRFTMATTTSGDSLWIAVDRSSVHGRAMDTQVQRFALASVDLEGLVIGALSHGSAPVDTTSVPLWLDQRDGFRYWTQDWDLAIDTLRLKNGVIAFHADSISAPVTLLDPAHLVYNAVGIGAREVVVNNARVALALDSLSFRGGPGGERILMSTRLDATPAKLAVTNGRLEALNNSFTFHTIATPGDLSVAYRTPEAVPIEAEVTGDVGPTDLLPLLHRLGVELSAQAAAEERWTTRLWMEGSVQDIRQAGIQLDGDRGSIIQANGRIRNAAQWPNSDYALTVNELTLGLGLRQVMRAFSPADVPLPMRMTLHADATGRGLDARAHVDLKSDLGDLQGTAEAHDWKGGIPGHLDMDLTATDIDAARLAGDTALGPMSFTLAASGERLHEPSRKASLIFVPAELSYLGNDLSHLRLKADAAGDSLHTELTSDAHAAAFTLRTAGPWPVPGDSLVLAFDLVLESLRSKELGLTPYELNMDGPVSGRIAMLPGILGRYGLQATGLRMHNAEREFQFDHLTLNGLLDSDSTAIELDCDAARINYHANLSVDSTLVLLRDRLLGAFQETYAFQPPPGRHIDLKVDLRGTERLMGLIHPSLHALEAERFEGRYDSDHDSLDLVVEIPLLHYADAEVRGLLLDLHAVGPALEGELAVRRIMRDSLRVDDVVLQATNVPGALRTQLLIQDGDTDRYRIGLDLRRMGDSTMAHLLEEQVLNGKVWNAQTGNAIHIGPDGFHARDLVITSGPQRIELRTGTDGNHLDIADFELTNLSGLVRGADSLAVMQGTMDASILLPLSERERLRANVTLRQLEVMDVPMGTVVAILAEDHSDHYEGSVMLDGGPNQVGATFEVDIGEGSPRIIVDSDLDLKDLALLKPLVQPYLFDLSGAVNGDLHYEQDGGTVKVIGRTAITDWRIGLIQTGAVYRIPNDTVTFDGNGLSLNDLEVRDAKDNRFRLDGRINTGVEREPRLDLRLRTERFQLVNSTAKENPMFYGKLFGGIDLHIGGTASTPSVKGEVSVLDSTAISVVLPGSKVAMIDHEGIVKFTADLDNQDTLLVRTDSEMLRDSLAAQLPGVDLDLRLKLDRNARFAIVIDPTTGDAATFRGEANLLFRYNPEGDIYLQGPFTVVDGGYTVEFYGLVKKRFELVPGGTIIWNGDPLAGRMDIQAKFSTKAAPYPLVANWRGGLTEGERNALQAPLPFDILINVREAVQAPNISFGLDMDRQVRNSYPQVNSVLDQLAKPSNQEELNRQVFGLLVLSTFIENEANADQGGSSLASTAARNSVNSILTQQLNRLTGQGIKGMDIQLGVNTYDQTEGGENYSRTTVDYKVTQRVLNDRVSIEAGGSIGYNERRQDVSAMSNTRAPQYAISYDLTTDGRLRLRLYHENAFDLYDGELVNNGVAIMLSRDFEKNAKELGSLRQEFLKEREAGNNEEEKP